MVDSKLEHRLKTKNKGGRPRGSKTVTKMSAGRLMDLFDGCYSAEEWARRFKKLSPESQFKYRAQLEPRAKEERTSSTFQLVISGLAGKAPITCPKCQHTFTVAPTTQPEAPGAPIVPVSIPETDPNRPKVYVPSEKAIAERAARDAIRASGPPPGDDWPDDGFPDV